MNHQPNIRLSSGSDFPPPGMGTEYRPAPRQDDAGGAPGGSDDEAHVRAASLLPFDEIKVDTDLLKGSLSSEADELICKICHTYFLGCAPKHTKCGHAFCGDCLESWIQVQPTFRSWAQVAKTAGQARLVPCPVCKTPLNDKADILLIIGEGASTDPECQRLAKMLRSLQLVCHNNPTVTQGFGSCSWEGKYTDYQHHARYCNRNKKHIIIEPNTSAPAQSHSETKKAREHASVTVIIPFSSSDVSVVAGSKVKIEEKSENGWIYIKNDETHGWVPEYCIKRYDQWFEDLMTSLGKQVEKCVAVRDFDPKSISDHVSQEVLHACLPLREGEVITICERSRSGWNLAINSDGSKQGWVPDNRCRIIREGGGTSESHENIHNQPLTVLARGSTYVVRRSFEGRSDDKSELSLNAGEVVSVRQATDSGWTLGVVVAQGSRKEGWFPDWIIDRSNIDDKASCAVCKQVQRQQPAYTFVRTVTGPPKDVYSPVCSQKCWTAAAKKRQQPNPGAPIRK